MVGKNRRNATPREGFREKGKKGQEEESKFKGKRENDRYPHGCNDGCPKSPEKTGTGAKLKNGERANMKTDCTTMDGVADIVGSRMKNR